MMPITLVNVVAMLACKGEEATPNPNEPSPVELPGVLGNQPSSNKEPETCDAGQDVWVQRAFPLMFGRKGPDGKDVPGPLELVRLAIPRRVYTQSHIDYLIEAILEVNATRDRLRGYRITAQAPFLRHFTAEMEPLADPVGA